MLGKVASAIGDAGGTIGSVDLVSLEGGHTLRDITSTRPATSTAAQIVTAIDGVDGATVIDSTDRTLRMHVGGKIEQRNKHPLKTRDDLSMAYTPGVARVCMAIHDDRDKAFQYTIKRNTVAVVSDGSAVLGLGDIGPEASMPVMEGKCMLFKEFAASTRSRSSSTPTTRRDRRHRRGDRARLRRHQPRGHLGPALLRDRGAPARVARHPRLPRRPARHRGRRARRAAQRGQDHRPPPRGPQRADRRARRRRRRHGQDPRRRGRDPHHRLRLTRRAAHPARRLPRRHHAARQALVRGGDEPRAPHRRPRRRDRRRRPLHRARPAPA